MNTNTGQLYDAPQAIEAQKRGEPVRELTEAEAREVLEQMGNPSVIAPDPTGQSLGIVLDPDEVAERAKRRENRALIAAADAEELRHLSPSKRRARKRAQRAAKNNGPQRKASVRAELIEKGRERLHALGKALPATSVKPHIYPGKVKGNGRPCGHCGRALTEHRLDPIYAQPDPNDKSTRRLIAHYRACDLRLIADRYETKVTSDIDVEPAVVNGWEFRTERVTMERELVGRYVPTKFIDDESDPAGQRRVPDIQRTDTNNTRWVHASAFNENGRLRG